MGNVANAHSMPTVFVVLVDTNNIPCIIIMKYVPRASGSYVSSSFSRSLANLSLNFNASFAPLPRNGSVFNRSDTKLMIEHPAARLLKCLNFQLWYQAFSATYYYKN